MAKLKKLIVCFVCAAVLALTLVPLAFGAATVQLTSTRSLVSISNIFTVTVRFTTDDIGAVEASVQYDDTLLEYVSGTNVGAGGDGSVVIVALNPTRGDEITATLVFKALKAGDAEITLGNCRVYDFDMNNDGSPTASVSVSITSEITVPSDVDISGILTAAKVDIDGQTRYLWRELASVAVPTGCERHFAQYEDAQIEAAINTSTGDILLYTTALDGLDGRWYIYDDAGNFGPYRRLVMGEKYYTATDSAPEGLPYGYTETEVTVDGVTLRAWQNPTEGFSHLFVLYLLDASGTGDLFLYNQTDETIQRFKIIDTIYPIPSTLKEAALWIYGEISTDWFLLGTFAALVLIILVLAILLTVKSVKLKKLRKYGLSPLPDEDTLEEQAREWVTLTEDDGEYIELVPEPPEPSEPEKPAKTSFWKRRKKTEPEPQTEEQPEALPEIEPEQSPEPQPEPEAEKPAAEPEQKPAKRGLFGGLRRKKYAHPDEGNHTKETAAPEVETVAEQPPEPRPESEAEKPDDKPAPLTDTPETPADNSAAALGLEGHGGAREVLDKIEKAARPADAELDKLVNKYSSKHKKKNDGAL